MRYLRRILFLAAAAPLGLAACSSTTDYSTVATAQEPVRTGQHAEAADARASNQQTTQDHQRSLTK